MASAAMFFAVASSAFILRAQMPLPEECTGSDAARLHSQGHTQIEAVEVELVDSQAPKIQSVPCGEPLIQKAGDGPATVVFHLCDPEP